jgi:hypothetical protein
MLFTWVNHTKGDDASAVSAEDAFQLPEKTNSSVPFREMSGARMEEIALPPGENNKAGARDGR